VNEDKTARYHALKRGAALLSVGWSAAFLLFFAATTASTWLSTWAARLVSSLPLSASLVPTAVVVVYVTCLGVLHEAGSLPLAFYRGFLVERRYGLSTESVRRWVADQATAAVLGAGVSLAGFSLLYAAIRQWPRGWWMAAGAGFSLFSVFMAWIGPRLIVPLFFRVRPLERVDLRERLAGVARQAGLPVTGVFEWQLSDRTKKANAALTGLGRARRILVSDTLVAAHSDDEIEVVVAHELGHHAHHDIWKAVALQCGVSLLAFFLASRALLALAPRMGWRGAADVAGIPVLLLTAGLLSLVLVPAVNAFSRRAERAADRYAWEVTRKPAAFASAMQRLGAQNFAEERPSPLVRWLFYTHPPFGERIEAARAWERRHQGPPVADQGGSSPES
jgi:STE24 endopeptidase